MELRVFLIENEIPFEEDVLLSSKTWIKTGGVCKYWITPGSASQLKAVCEFLFNWGGDFDVVGNTSNMFFHSTYNPECVVSTVKVNQYHIDGDVIHCECGANVMNLAKECLNAGYAGFYGLVGLPGTVGSAIVGNAGCFDCSLSSMMLRAEVLLPDGRMVSLQKEDFGFEKRSSTMKRGELKGVIISVDLRARKTDGDDDLAKAEKTRLYRKNYQERPRLNLGSVFSQRTQRRNIKNVLASYSAKVLSRLLNKQYRALLKYFLLRMYGYSDLEHYISNRNINTFIWQDSEAEVKFERYKEFMGKVFKDLKIEIEEKK